MRNGSGLLVILGYSPPHTQTGDQENRTVERVSWNVCNSEPIMISNGMSGYALINLPLFVRKKWIMWYLVSDKLLFSFSGIMSSFLMFRSASSALPSVKIKRMF